VPIHVAENGWPTGPERSYGQQAEAIESIIRTINDYRGNYNVTHYELFDLRDADSSNPGMFSQFGILHDDYTPKPAFEVYRKLVEELSAD
jgi:exo-beta-1,3-glucanase (GH17 family)